jgi:hypothetical protein
MPYQGWCPAVASGVRNDPPDGCPAGRDECEVHPTRLASEGDHMALPTTMSLSLI